MTDSTTKKHKDNLVWLDMEMSGLNASQDVILEVAVVITDSQLNVIAETPSYAIYQPNSIIENMDKWNTNTHSKSGLIQRVQESVYEVSQIEHKLINFLKKYTYKNQSPLCGNTIHQDRKFIVKYMPLLEEYLHYRNLDVSTIKELAKRWYPENIMKGFTKHNKHEALADIHESIAELKYYRTNIFTNPYSHT